MSQHKAWETEYKEMKMITGNADPQKDVLRYFKFLKKDKNIVLNNKVVLDLGCGTGRNSNYLATLGNAVHGIEISKTALKIAKERARKLNVNVDYILGDFGQKLIFSDNYFDLVLDVTSSNALTDKERECYLQEVNRVLKPGGQFFVRALSKEGDKNAKNLLKNFPGPDPDTYYMKDLGIYEKVFTQESFENLYSPHFQIEKLLKKTGYASINGRKFKRNYLLAYLSKNDGKASR